MPRCASGWSAIISPSAAPSTAALRVDGISLRFGGHTVLDNVGFDVEAGTICGLVGPNGAGKTSLFNCITGSYVPHQGVACFDVPNSGVQDLLKLPPHRLAAIGVARTFQHPTLDPAASALDNALCGGHVHLRGNWLTLGLGLQSVRRDELRLRAQTEEILDQLDLSQWAKVPACDLPYGLQKKVELARALMTRPRLLLLDEPAGGLPNGEVAELGALLRKLREQFKLTIVLVEHHMGLISSITDKVVVLVEGKVVLQGSAAEIQKHPIVIEAYLGAAA
ncbi:MAG: ABC transporter ATP-binding protein [Rhodoferax sp.]|nr:ABC transporter ATP-binding protein [Rhodoferax sp.]